MRLVVSLSGLEVKELIKKKKLESASNIQILEEHTIKMLTELLEELTGYDNIPIMGVSKINGKSVSLKRDFNYIINILNLTSGDFVFICNIEDDEVISVENDDLINYESELDENEDFLDFYDEEAKAHFSLGSKKEHSNEIVFIPKIKLSDCIGYVMLSDEWSAVDQELSAPGIIQLEKLNVI